MAATATAAVAVAATHTNGNMINLSEEKCSHHHKKNPTSLHHIQYYCFYQFGSKHCNYYYSRRISDHVISINGSINCLLEYRTSPKS
jgi:hypothetical protein